MLSTRCFKVLLCAVLLLNIYSCSTDSKGNDNVKKITISSDVATGLVNGSGSGPSDTHDS